MNYTSFIILFRDFICSGISKQDAVKRAVNVCISKGILTDVLQHYKKEILYNFQKLLIIFHYYVSMHTSDVNTILFNLFS